MWPASHPYIGYKRHNRCESDISYLIPDCIIHSPCSMLPHSAHPFNVQIPEVSYFCSTCLSHYSWWDDEQWDKKTCCRWCVDQKHSQNRAEVVWGQYLWICWVLQSSLKGISMILHEDQFVSWYKFAINTVLPVNLQWFKLKHSSSYMKPSHRTQECQQPLQGAFILVLHSYVCSN